ncbi:hypothetical protein EJV47_20775 [Hymenobacter gummosus]|uniref:T9SS type A sorting domain-containing protein n=1 Tax=Hymenobacter gummosus TaxID=1776032 RepID=A0A431TXV8_9BACT|nr:hypothetical protein [Hymenobacter gummosus]RTQ46809.1 hypothetical protein EJV47_20775 [Hymenobacter gummosus]
MLRNFTLAPTLRARLTAVLLTSLAPLALAQQVGPDANFGTAGTVTTGLTGPRFNFSSISAGSPVWSVMGQALVQPDGKVLVCAADANRWTLRRYLADGTPDTGFGTGGSVTSTFPAGNASGLALQPNGQIVVVGGVPGGVGNVWAAARYSPQGVLDTSFGTNGLAYGSSGTGPSELARVVVLPNGKLLAAASYDRNYPTRLVRLLANGQPDNTFVSSGTNSYMGYAYNGMFRDLLVQPDGKILVTTTGFGNAGGIPITSARLARYNADGTPDTGFGTNGEVPITGYSTIPGQQNSPRNTAIHSLALQPDGKILAAGCVDNGQVSGGNAGENPALFRLNADGSPDAAFNTAVAASIRTSLGGGFAAVTLQSDGSIVVGGSFGQQRMLARYSPAGVLDASFATVTGYPAGLYVAGTGSIVRTLSTLPNDQLLAWEGVGNTSNGMDMRLTRYTAARPTALRRSELALQLLAAPVPTGGPLHLRYTLPAAATPQALLRDQLGRTVATVGGARQAAGPQALELDLQRVAAGSYFLTLEAGPWQQTVRVVKQ